MKTLQTIITATAILFFTTFSFANNKSENILSIEIIHLNNPSCQGATNGSVLVEASGGVAPYSYNWNTFPNQFSRLAVNLSAGTYFIYVTDAVGNKFYEPIKIVDPDEKAKPETLQTQNDISLVEIGPVAEAPLGPFCMKLNGEVTSYIDYNELEVGIYRLEIIDGNNCVTTSFIQVFEYEKAGPEDLIRMARAKNSELIIAQPRVELISIHNRNK